MPVAPTPVEYLRLAAIPMSNPGFIINDLSQLLDGPDQRGTDRILPGAVGVVAFPRRITISKRQCPMTIYGDHDTSGNDTADQCAGLEANITWLIQNVLAIPGTSDGCRAGYLHLAGGVVLGPKRVRVLSPLQLGAYGPRNQRGVLSLEFPSGV